MKNSIIILLFLPILSFSQISIGTGLLAVGDKNIETGLAYTGSVTFKNDRLASGVKFSRSTIKEVDFNFIQLFIGPHFKNFHVGVTFDYSFSKYENLKVENHGLGIRAAGYFELIEHFGIFAEVNPSFDGSGVKYIQALAGAFYRL